ncbi:MAG: curli-like amyloid fiber formation chaperone CsgH [Jannaschia helgolandensis]|uniref:curli-like amyloid fiber formation chaperone CsgH n=1 Tax=Jannaschia helgolandensis TaxID=188906 RepID=UPI003C77A7C7
MLPEPLLPLVLVLALDAAAPEPCRLLIDGANGRYEVTAEITPPDVGQLTYAIEITVESGASRSRATNRGTVQVLEAGKSMALWQGVFGGTPEATMQVRLIATMGDAEITCEATLP